VSGGVFQPLARQVSDWCGTLTVVNVTLCSRRMEIHPLTPPHTPDMAGAAGAAIRPAHAAENGDNTQTHPRNKTLHRIVTDHVTPPRVHKTAPAVAAGPGITICSARAGPVTLTAAPPGTAPLITPCPSGAVPHPAERPMA